MLTETASRCQDGFGIQISNGEYSLVREVEAPVVNTDIPITITMQIEDPFRAPHPKAKSWTLVKQPFHVRLVSYRMNPTRKSDFLVLLSSKPLQNAGAVLIWVCKPANVLAVTPLGAPYGSLNV